MLRFDIGFVFIIFPAHLIFFVFSIRLLMHSKLSAAYAVWHYAQRGSGTYTDSPGSFREVGCCLLAALTQVGTVCTWSLCQYLGIQRSAYSEEDYIGMVGGRLEVVFSGTRLESAMIQCSSSKLVGIACPQNDIRMIKEVTTDLTLWNGNEENVADLFCLYVSTTQVENTLLCIGFQCLLSLWYV